jgi:hypothetical protein
MKEYMKKRRAAGKDKPRKIDLTVNGRTSVYTREALERLLSSTIPPNTETPTHINRETLSKPKIVNTPPLTQKLTQRPTTNKPKLTPQERETEVKKKHQLLMDLINAGELEPELLALVDELIEEASQKYVDMIEELDSDIFRVVERWSLEE